jgi:hypothetical protein
LAPQSRKSSGGLSRSGTGICTASAGLWTPCARFSANRAAVIVAPVEPALTSELQPPAATAAAARTTDASGVERTAATGSASLPIHSVVGSTSIPGDELREEGPKMRTGIPPAAASFAPSSTSSGPPSAP